MTIHDEMFTVGGPRKIPVMTYAGFHGWAYVKEGDIWKLCRHGYGDFEHTFFYFKEGSSIVTFGGGIDNYMSPITERSVLESALGISIYGHEAKYPCHPKRFRFEGKSYPLCRNVVMKRGREVLRVPSDWVLGFRRTHKHRNHWGELYNLVLSYRAMFGDWDEAKLKTHPAVKTIVDDVGERAFGQFHFYSRPNTTECMNLLLRTHHDNIAPAMINLTSNVPKRLSWLALDCLQYKNRTNRNTTLPTAGSKWLHAIAQRIAIMSAITFGYDDKHEGAIRLYCSLVTNHAYIKEVKGFDKS